MRTIPAALLAKIQSLNHTITGNADPKRWASVIKADKTLQIKTVANTGILGAIDLTINWPDLTADPTEVWIIEVINKAAVVKVYTYSDTIDYSTPTRSFTLTVVGTGAVVRDAAISFDGTFVEGEMQTSGAPWLFWLERTSTHYKAYALQWDGADPAVQPAATELLSVER